MSTVHAEIKVWHKGIPTEHDVRKLQDAFLVPQEGRVITHEEIESLLGITRKTCRYRTVIGLWRDRLAIESHLYMKAQNGVGYLVLDPTGCISSAYRKFELSDRARQRAMLMVYSTDVARLSDEGLKKRTWMINRDKQIRLHSKIGPKKITME